MAKCFIAFLPSYIMEGLSGFRFPITDHRYEIIKQRIGRCSEPLFLKKMEMWRVCVCVYVFVLGLQKSSFQVIIVHPDLITMVIEHGPTTRLGDTTHSVRAVIKA